MMPEARLIGCQSSRAGNGRLAMEWVAKEWRPTENIEESKFPCARRGASASLRAVIRTAKSTATLSVVVKTMAKRARWHALARRRW
jgi:hypothetical protein